MYNIEVPTLINQIIALFYFMGMWRDNMSNFRKWSLKTWYLFVYICYPILLFIGASMSDSEIESIFLGVGSIMSVVVTVRLYYILSKEDQILKFISFMGNHSIKDREKFNQVNRKISAVIKFSTYLMWLVVCGILILILLALPIFSTVPRLPMNIYLPFNWKNGGFVYWAAFVFVTYELVLSFSSVFLSVLIWYLMLSCATKYQILGSEFRNMVLEEKITLKTNIVAKSKFVVEELITLIKNHQELQTVTHQFSLCFSNLFFVQITTSSINICGSIYALSQSSPENILSVTYIIVFLYNLFDIFMVSYLGNEIKLSSIRLSYCVFESNWLDQCASCREYFTVLMEVLKRPQELVVGKIFPLNLEIFTSILNLSYTMINILKNLKQ